MNEPTIRLESHPGVAGFVQQVRERLEDLTEEEREELVGGLEADLSELVADGGSVAELGDPRAYADELRTAAGLEPRRARRAGQGSGEPLAARTTRRLDELRRRWDSFVAERGLTGLWAFVVTLRPVWWVFRAWVAVQLLDQVLGGGTPAPVPAVGGALPGLVVLVVAVVVSVQVGRGRVWPGTASRAAVGPRMLLLGLNGVAVLVAPLVLGQFPSEGAYAEELYAGPVSEGLRNGEEYVENVFPYDAQGRPLTGVQLFDQDGRPLTVTGASSGYADTGTGVLVGFPWVNGGQELFNVFPLPVREESYEEFNGGPTHDAWTSATPPALPAPPLAVVPPAALPTPSPTSSPSATTPAPVPSPTPSGEADSEKPAPR